MFPRIHQTLSNYFSSTSILTRAFSSTLQQQDHNGNNVMHLCIQNATSLKEIESTIQKLGRDAVSPLLKMPNNQGRLPYDLLRKQPFTHEEFALCQTKLLELMPTQLPPIHEQINIDKILQQYYGTPPHVFNNIALACEMVNETRSVVKQSSTHPMSNQLPIEDQYALDKKKDIIRAQHHRVSYLEAPTEFLANVANLLKLSQLGTCYECSLYMLHLLHDKKLPVDFQASRQSFANGDHTWNTFYTGVAVAENLRLPQTVNADAWSGKVTLAHETDKLHGYRLIVAPDKRIVNVLTSYNPSFHRFKTNLIFTRPDPTDKPIIRSMGK